MFEPPYLLLADSYFRKTKQIESLLIKNKIKDNEFYGTQLTYSFADRIQLYLSNYPQVAIKIQFYLINNFPDHEIIFKINNMLINKEFGDFDHSEILNLSILCMILIFSNGTIESADDIVSININSKTKVISLCFSDLIYLINSKNIVLLVTSLSYLLEELHLQDTYQISYQNLNNLLEMCNKVIPSDSWDKDGYIYNFISRLSIELITRSFFNKEREILTYVLYAFISEIEKFAFFTDYFAIDRWNSILTDKFVFNIKKQVIKYPFLNKIRKLYPIFASIDNKGLRIVLGRSRNTGFGTIGLNPITIISLKYLKSGDQILLDDPFNNIFAVQPVNSIHGPLIKLHSGSILRLNTISVYNKIKNEIKLILSLGDILIDYLDIPSNLDVKNIGNYHNIWIKNLILRLMRFSKDEQNHILSLLGIDDYLKNTIINQHNYSVLNSISPIETTAYCNIVLYKKYQIPIHPNWTPKWSNIKNSEWRYLRNWIMNTRYWDEKTDDPYITYLKIEGGIDSDVISILEKSEIEFEIKDDKIIISHWGYILYHIFLDKSTDIGSIEPPDTVFNPNLMLNKTGKIKFIIESGYRINFALNDIAKARINKLSNSYNGFYPNPSSKLEIESINNVLKKLGLNFSLDTISFCGSELYKKTSDVVPELLEKVLLRKKHELFIYKDSLIHFLCINTPLTSFKPKEINVDIGTLKKLGYTTDMYGENITSIDQEIIIFPFDIIIPKMFLPYILNVLKFLKDELNFIFNENDILKSDPEDKDILGVNIIGINKNTTLGTYGRIIGFTNSLVCYASPIWHLSKTSYCNGDLTDSFVLDLDCFINLNLTQLHSKKGMLKGVPIFTQIKPDLKYIYNNLDHLLRNNSSKEQWDQSKIPFINYLVNSKSILEHVNFNKPYFTFYTTEIIKNIDEMKFKNEFELISSKIEKLKEIISENYLFELIEIEKIFNHFLINNFLKYYLIKLQSKSDNQFICLNCNTIYELPVYDNCISCEGKISIKNYRDELVIEFNLLKNLVKQVSNINIYQMTKDLMFYIEVKL